MLSLAECPLCYSFIQEEVDLLRVYITRLQAEFSLLVNQPTMLHNDTFNDRFHKLVTEVIELTQSLIRAWEAESNATVQWRLFSVVMNDLNTLNGTIAVAVNQTVQFTAIVEANKRETEFTVIQIRDLVTEASRLLKMSLDRKLDEAENSTSLLANQAGKLMNLQHIMKREENRTVEAGELIHTRVEHAVEIANKSTEMARNVTEAQIHLDALLPQLHKNASAIRVLGETTITMASDKLAMANRAYNHSVQKLNEASQANPDRSGVSIISMSYESQLRLGSFQICPRLHSVRFVQTLISVMKCPLIFLVDFTLTITCDGKYGMYMSQNVLKISHPYESNPNTNPKVTNG